MPVATGHFSTAITYFETIEALEAVVAERCLTLDASPDLYEGRNNFNWWLKTNNPI